MRPLLALTAALALPVLIVGGVALQMRRLEREARDLRPDLDRHLRRDR